MVKFFVEGHPSTLHRPRVTARGTYMEPEYAAWRARVGWTAKEYCPEPLIGWLVVSLHFVTTAWERQDLDNLAKGVLEGLQGVLFVDDRQVSSLHLFKSQAEDREGVLVMCWGILEFAVEWERSIAKVFSLLQEQEEER